MLDHAMPIMLIVLGCLVVAYRFYSLFLARHVAVLDENRRTPAHEFNDGQNYHPTHRWVLFGHHFAAISGAGPLIGPVLAIQFGYLPGLLWIVVGVCLAGAVQDMLVLAASVRRGGRSLAEIARLEIGTIAGGMASVAILFVVIIALSGLGVVVVKALGGEEVELPAGTSLLLPDGGALAQQAENGRQRAEIPPGTRVLYPNGAKVDRSERFILVAPTAKLDVSGAGELKPSPERLLKLPTGTKQLVAGSSWGTFTIACTIPIALFVGLYMYRIRKGRVVEASAIGAVAVLAATLAGDWVRGSPLESYFSLTKDQTVLAICVYGFVASVLPVWMLLCPRDYLSSFLKIGTVALLVGAVIVANPKLQAPQINPVFASGGGPYFNGAIFPFCFICIMCGAVSGFHALVSSGTTPKMISSESHVRIIGYGAMLIEGLVGVVALLAAASLPQGDYWAINIDLPRAEKFAPALEQLGANVDRLDQIERQVGGESLRGRTGGAVTLAVGMSEILREATRRLSGRADELDGVLKYWYHFAIMFEALFILTTIDTGTRIARFLLQELLGKFFKKFDQTDWLPGAVISTALVTAGWGALIWTGSIDTIWPMFGIANQLLAVIALAVVTTVMFNSGRGRYCPITLLPMAFVIASTMTAGYQMITGRFWVDMVQQGERLQNTALVVKGYLNIGFTAFMMASVLVILASALIRWVEPRPTDAGPNRI